MKIRILIVAAVLATISPAISHAGDVSLQHLAALTTNTDTGKRMTPRLDGLRLAQQSCCSSTSGNPNCSICCPTGHAAVCSNPAIPNVGPGTCVCK
jgi:hypothetical protein